MAGCVDLRLHSQTKAHQASLSLPNSNPVNHQTRQLFRFRNQGANYAGDTAGLARRTSSGKDPVISVVGGGDNLASPRGSPSMPLLLNQDYFMKTRQKQPDFVGRDTTLFKQGRKSRTRSQQAEMR